jgi:hypothetical protein
MTLANNLWKDRYIEVTKQARRLPIAVVLIVDQDHVDRVLNAFNNTPLRFLTTQVLLNHYPRSVRPTFLASAPGAGPGFPGPGFPMPGPGYPSPGNFPGGPAGQEGSADMEANIELVIYGVVTLYERFPPRPTPTAGR